MDTADSLRIIENRDAAREDWNNAVHIQPVRRITAHMAGPWDCAMPNGERPPAGYMVVTNREGKAEYCLSWADFFSLYHPTHERDVYAPNRNTVKRMILLDEPFHLKAPEAWATNGHQGWRVTDRFRHAVDNHIVLDGFPIIEEKPGQEYHADPGLWRGDYKIVPQGYLRPAA